MLAINFDDVISVLKSIAPHLTAVGVMLVMAIIVTIGVRKLAKEKKSFIRKEAWLVFLLGLIVVLNLILTGPMFNMVTLATGNGKIKAETSEAAKQLGEDIASEGIVLLQNENNMLPLEKGKKLNVFGWSSTNPVYGGTGSGGLNDAYPTVSLLEGLQNAGFEVNQDIVDFYTDFRTSRPTIGMWGQDWTIPEPSIDEYKSAGIIEKAKSYSDTAVVVLGRSGGEGADLPTSLDPNTEATFVDGGTFGSTGIRYSEYKDDLDASKHYLELSNREKAMLDEVTANFNNVIIVLNSANTLELGFVDDYSQIKSVIWCPGAGQSGFNSLGKVLDGEVNPSAKTSDTFIRDLTKAPYFNNIGNFVYENMTEFPMEDHGNKYTPSFVNYVEGIYVGYRFWETAAVEGLIDYDENVQYPFGYGLSYTSFDQKMGELKVDQDSISVDVTITNTGDKPGKEVAEIYFNPPYTNGGIEKSAVNLAGFAKTKLLESGESETLTISFPIEELASYDSDNAKAYVLEKGDYKISLQSDSHNVIDTKVYNVPETIIYSADNKRTTDVVAATNQLDDVKGDIEYLSRKDGFANYAKVTAAPSNYALSEENKKNFFNNSNYDPTAYNDDSDEMPVTGANNDLKLVDMRGLDYDDPSWDKLLDQLTIDDMDTLIALDGYQTPAAKSVGKVQTVDCDGPASINNNFTGTGSIGFPAGVMIANTFNADLAKAFGESIGTMADEMHVSGWYAPAMNTHRSAFGGRNFEYYSEDPILAGMIAMNAVQGAAEKGVYAYIKHFAINDQETNRNYQLCTWFNEQSAREIYLKPFELCVKEGGARAVMTAFNFYGVTPAYASNAVLNNILRGEWGFRGFCETDYYGVYGYQDSDRAIRNGNDACLTAIEVETNHVTDKSSATSVKAMRQSAKNILYTTVNSRAYAPENLKTGLMAWQICLIIADVIIAVLIALMAIKAYRNYAKRVVVFNQVEHR